jgi:hypothetical protein
MMAHKKKRSGSIPAGNRTVGEDWRNAGAVPTTKARRGQGSAFQDAKRRVGNFSTAGEHSFVQPGGKKDANR